MGTVSKMITLKFNIRNWSAWKPGVDGPAAWQNWANGGCLDNEPPQTKPDVSYMPAMLRRRLSPIARAAVHVAWQCLEGNQNTPVIFSSVYGESEHTLMLTEAVAGGEPVSPTAFSLSVHNAIAGQLTIARHITAEATCLSPAGGGVLPALLEAQGLLQEGCHERVLVVFCDQPLPSVYRASQPGPSELLACALLITTTVLDNCYSLQRITASGEKTEEQETQLVGLIRVLLGKEHSTRLKGMGSEWCWERSSAQA